MSTAKRTRTASTKKTPEPKKLADYRIVNLTGEAVTLYNEAGLSIVSVFPALHPKATLLNESRSGNRLYGLPVKPRVTAIGVSSLPEAEEADTIVYIVPENVGEWARINLILYPATFIGPDTSCESNVPAHHWGGVGVKRFIVYKQ
jgi:hypothetical protein